MQILKFYHCTSAIIRQDTRMSNAAQQVITFGTQKLLLLNGTAHKLDSAIATAWAEEWFTKNWASVKVIGGAVHLPSLSVISKAAADFVANSDYRGRRDVLAAIADGKMMHSLAMI
jgi:hypothetical protein